MTTHLTPSWKKPPIFVDYISELPDMEFTSPSVLRSVRLRQSLEQSRKAFLSFSGENHELQQSKENDVKRATPGRKISFKCKKPSSVIRKNPIVPPRIALATVNSNIVAELTSKFNQMVGAEELTPNKAKVKTVSRKPSVKTKPDLSKVKRKNSVKRSTSIIRAKGESGTVKAAIEIFERRSTPTEPPPNPKPKVPDRKPVLRPRTKVFSKSITVCDSSPSILSPETVKRVAEETDAILQRCDELARNVGNQSFISNHTLKVVPESQTPSLSNSSQLTNFTQLESQILPHEIEQPKNTQLEDYPASKFQKWDHDSEEVKRLRLDHTIAEAVNLKVQTNTNNLDKQEDKSQNQQLSTSETLNGFGEIQSRKMSLAPELQNLNENCQEVQTLRLKLSKLAQETVSIGTQKPRLSLPRNSQSLFDQQGRRSSLPPEHHRWTSDHQNPTLTSNSNEDAVKPLGFKARSEEAISAKPNSSFLWRARSPSSILESMEYLYDVVDPLQSAMNELAEHEEQEQEKIYEDLVLLKRPEDYYELLGQESDDGYEAFDNLPVARERIYETLPPVLPRRQEEPLPPRPPPSRNSFCGELVSNCYESIYNGDSKSNYESIYSVRENWEVASNRESLASSDHQSNSLYSRSLGGWPNEEATIYNGSEKSGSDRSDEWVDISDDENRQQPAGFVM